MSLFKKSALGNIARMICGDVPYNEIFPYRSSSYLTNFFHNLDLDYTHDGSTRYWWVLWVLEQLNAQPQISSELPSNEMVKVLESLVHPDYFCQGNPENIQAVNKLNEVLKPYELCVEIDPATSIGHLTSSFGKFISTSIQRKEIKKSFTFAPSVFNYPTIDQDPSLVAVMMPFSAEFNSIYTAIQKACINEKLVCHRADSIWSNSTIIQDVFDLIYASKIVVVDFSTKNSNVMYETGIAHTLGKIVIPITQSLDDIPFDLKPHRALKYLANAQGLIELTDGLEKRLRTLIKGSSWHESDIPF